MTQNSAQTNRRTYLLHISSPDLEYIHDIAEALDGLFDGALAAACGFDIDTPATLEIERVTYVTRMGPSLDGSKIEDYYIADRGDKS